jgi:hypothetical protein
MSETLRTQAEDSFNWYTAKFGENPLDMTVVVGGGEGESS